MLLLAVLLYPDLRSKATCSGGGGGGGGLACGHGNQ